MAQEFWGQLFADDERASDAFTRFADSAFSYIVANHEPKDSCPELTPGKLMWMYAELGYDDDRAPIPVDRLASYYRTFVIKFVMRQVGTGPGKVPALQRPAWLRLLTVCFLTAPEAAYMDMEQMISQWELIDPLTNNPFPPVPRTAAPQQPVPLYAAKHAQCLQNPSAGPVSPLASVPPAVLNQSLVTSTLPALVHDDQTRSLDPIKTASASPSTSFPPAVLSPAIVTSAPLALVRDEQTSPLKPTKVASVSPSDSMSPVVLNLKLGTSAQPALVPDNRTRSRDPTKIYGEKIIGASGNPSPGYARLLTAMFHTVLQPEPPDEQQELVTPYMAYKAFLASTAAVSKMPDLKASTLLFFSSFLRGFYDRAKVPYSMRMCSVPERALEIHPELTPLYRLGPRLHPCLDLAAYINLAIFNATYNPEATLREDNAFIQARRPIDPTDGAAFPPLPPSVYPVTTTEEDRENIIGAILSDCSRRQWKTKLVVLKETGELTSSEQFDRYLDCVFDCILQNAPPSQPETHVTCSDLLWWYTQVDRLEYCKLLQNDDSHEYWASRWRYLGISFDVLDVHGNGRYLGKQGCLSRLAWRNFQISEVAYDRLESLGEMSTALAKFPLVDPVKEEHFIFPAPELLPDDYEPVVEERINQPEAEFYAAQAAPQYAAAPVALTAGTAGGSALADRSKAVSAWVKGRINQAEAAYHAAQGARERIEVPLATTGGPVAGSALAGPSKAVWTAPHHFVFAFGSTKDTYLISHAKIGKKGHGIPSTLATTLKEDKYTPDTFRWCSTGPGGQYVADFTHTTLQVLLPATLAAAEVAGGVASLRSVTFGIESDTYFIHGSKEFRWNNLPTGLEAELRTRVAKHDGLGGIHSVALGVGGAWVIVGYDRVQMWSNNVTEALKVELRRHGTSIKRVHLSLVDHDSWLIELKNAKTFADVTPTAWNLADFKTKINTLSPHEEAAAAAAHRQRVHNNIRTGLAVVKTGIGIARLVTGT